MTDEAKKEKPKKDSAMAKLEKRVARLEKMLKETLPGYKE